MRPNVKFQVDLPKTNPSLAKSHLQKACGYTQKTALNTCEQVYQTFKVTLISFHVLEIFREFYVHFFFFQIIIFFKWFLNYT